MPSFSLGIPPSENRRFGLDLLRAGAILGVLWGHDLCSPNISPWIQRSGRAAILGVELFFVLSGFLIGGMIIELIRAGKFRSGAHLFHFWGRRWLRTLPLYYLFLALYHQDAFGTFYPFQKSPKFVFFLQNFATAGPPFFRLGWSLSIEEYFYFFFPLLCFVLLGLFRKALVALSMSVAVFLVVPFWLKALSPVYATWDGFDLSLRQVVLFRLDSLMYGVGAAVLFKYFPSMWERLRRFSAVGFGLVLAVSLYFYFDHPGLEGNRLPQLFLFPIISLGFALLLPYFEAMGRPRFAPIARAVLYLSMISYSAYLSHILVLIWVRGELTKTASGQALFDQPLFFVPFLMSVSLLVAALTYHLWEYPFLWLRDRLLPTRSPEWALKAYAAEAAR